MKWDPLPLTCKLERWLMHTAYKKAFDIQQADAEAAYTQCELKGTETWVRLPEDRWPDEWFKKDRYGKRVCRFYDPVCKLHKVFYGHPDAGTYWGNKKTEHTGKCMPKST